MVILTDSREQLPYKFQCPSTVGTIPVGDYSLVGLEDCIAVERKTLPDLISCLSVGRERFQRELFKARALDHFCLVVESDLESIVRGKYRSKMAPRAAIQSLVAFSIRYHCPVWLAGTRQYAERLTESILLKFAREISKKHQAIGGIDETNGTKEPF